ncbi:NADH:flavin oxidoreductase/NADH oxidase [Ilyomonas limi]|uniref:NADH:flavin oxidoreductase/NADH oxidase n=1 Tax=Ilyomonas limi TaxID=2575867 RepID=A0A4U3L782_9BACT|nr:NADH:flavin oxidoreductase/NADH oxidase [Ilyomonas limi]TKK70882.1 NADH:flavin oxidoreductase/NADH oxidase [Ilyomonas limi]
MSKLFSPLIIRNTTLKNRITISPMCQYSSVDGFANYWHLVHLGSRAVGGAALVMQEATAVSPEGRITYADMGLWKEEQIEKLKQIVDFIHAQGTLAGIQLAHAGRKASRQKPWDGGKFIPADEPYGWQTVAPSPIPFAEGDGLPAALDKTGIQKVIDDYVAAAKRAIKAGFDVVEIHAAHGYLFHEFYSPLSNKRTDEYGGTFKNRARLLLEVTEAVRNTWGNDKPLFIRISATDWTDGGWDIEDSVILSAMLKEKGADLIDTSSGGNVHAKIPLKPGYQVEFAERIKAEAGILTGAVGLITNAQQADMILEKEQSDIILIARESLRDPYFPLHAAQTLGDEIPWPVQYERAKPRK